MRIKYRWEALDGENDAIDQARKAKKAFHAEVLSNGGTLKQLLARSRCALYRRPDAWSPTQKERADLLFDKYPKLKQAYITLVST
jgi:hypothetical protein